MDPGKDIDPALQSLSADLEREDPALAALLSGRRVHRHSVAWALLTLLFLVPALLLPARVVLGTLAMLLIVSSPLLACWLCAAAENAVPPRAE